MSSTESAAVRYRRFPNVSEWVAGATLDTSVVDFAKKQLQDLGQQSAEVYARAINVVRDAAALETGAIENLYDLERGVTVTAATEGAILDSLGAQPEKVRALISSQLRAYEFVLDFVTKKQPIAEAWLRQLHVELCSAQQTYRVLTDVGAYEDRVLECGQYKTVENHVVTKAGKRHFYAPVLETAAEMRRFVEMLESPEFFRLDPVDQIAHAHYGLVAIHPFADGNGRMARAVGSIYCYRAHGVPLLITADQRIQYFDALESCDAGNYVPFRRFVRDRVADSVSLLVESLRGARIGTPAEAIGGIHNVFRTRGGYSHVAIDESGHQLLEKFRLALAAEIEKPEFKVPGLVWSIQTQAPRREFDSADHRRPISSANVSVIVTAQTRTPADAAKQISMGVAVPRDAAETDNIVLESGSRDVEPFLEVPVRNVLPSRTLFADISVAMFVRRVATYMVHELATAAKESLRNKGY